MTTEQALAGETNKSWKPRGRGAWVLGLCAACACVASVVVRHQAIPAYATVASVVLGAALLAVVFAMLASDSLPDVPNRGLRLNFFWALLAVGTIAMRIVAPGSPLLNWCFAPLFVMVMPGWSLGSALLPASTGYLERLFWAPVFSLSALVVTLMWMDVVGVRVWHPTIFFLAIAFTLAGAVIARLR